MMQEEKKSIPVKKHLWPDELAMIQNHQKIKFLKRMMIISIIFFLFVGWVFGSLFPFEIFTSHVTRGNDDKISTVRQIMEDEWYFGQDISQLDERLTNQALKGMTTNDEDLHTEYMSKQEVEEFYGILNRKYVGIGIEFTKDLDDFVVTKVFKNSPADQAGLQVGDFLIAVDQESLDGLTTQEVRERCLGEKDTTLTLTIMRQNQQQDIVLKRQEISATAYGYIDHDVAYLELSQFGEATAQQAKAYFEDFQQQNISNLVLDLRENGGGYITACVDIASLLMPSDQVVLKEVDKQGKQEIHKTKNQSYYHFDRIVVLINENSASASEVLTLALKENLENVQIVGVQSYGKGTVQVAHSFEDGSALKVTNAKWISKNDEWINKVGITPDVVEELPSVYTSELDGLQDEEVVGIDQVHMAVKTMQLCLQQLGYTMDRTDGYMSKASLDVLHQYQKNEGLAIQDQLDKQTLASIYGKMLNQFYQDKTKDTQYQKAMEVIRGKS